ncbi:MAG: GDP-mannose 4,6-dehydratase [candidate division Zixibacteria bacterium]|nr:GDP-mannose 4,6-dehydratase [candidate division Zixibacteria bacterium]
MPAPRVFITGIAGFAGSHLAELCLDAGDVVFGTWLPGTSTRNLDAIRDEIEITAVDLLNPKALTRVLQRIRPTWVIHLAASTSVGDSFSSPGNTIRNNVISSLNLLEAIRQDRNLMKSVEKIVMLASNEVYGRVRPSQIPVDENTPLRPVNPYGASKAAVDLIAESYRASFKLPTVRVRASNHTGPRQAPGFVVPDFCNSIARLERKSGKRVMKVGDLSARRDFSDVRDIVKGYRQLAQDGKPGIVYHLGSGKVRSIQSVLDSLLKLATQPITAVVDPKKLRPVEVPILRADISRAQRDVGFKPSIPWNQTLLDTLEYYRQCRSK